jgi:hypothetical protein
MPQQQGQSQYGTGIYNRLLARKRLFTRTGWPLVHNGIVVALHLAEYVLTIREDS